MTTIQRLTLTLAGLTAGDYLAHVRDPDPPGLRSVLRSISVDAADPLGDTVEAVLVWQGAAPSAAHAEILAGLPVTPEVVHVECRPLHAVAA